MEESLLQFFAYFLWRDLLGLLDAEIFVAPIVLLVLMMLLLFVFLEDVVIPVFDGGHGFLDFLQVVQDSDHPRNILLLVHVEDDGVSFSLGFRWSYAAEGSQHSLPYYIFGVALEELVAFCGNQLGIVVGGRILHSKLLYILAVFIKSYNLVCSGEGGA